MSEMGRDGAACALAFLTHVPEACRQGWFIKLKNTFEKVIDLLIIIFIKSTPSVTLNSM